MSSLNENLTSLAYLVAAVLFIMALRGLSSPESSRKGNLFGMLGMTIAVVTTMLSPAVTSWLDFGGTRDWCRDWYFYRAQDCHDRNAAIGCSLSQLGRYGSSVGCRCCI